jgi:hypothetical protein
MSELEKGVTNKFSGLARAIQEVAREVKMDESKLILKV